MKITKTASYNEMSRVAADMIIADIKQKPDLLLCAATGGSPSGTYSLMSEEKDRYDASRLRIVKLDEWGGVSMKNPGTCESYVQSELIGPLGVTPDRYLGFEGNSTDPEKERDRVAVELDKIGPIDICTLGIGTNGHIGFNEPAEYLSPFCHITPLASKTMQHTMVTQMDKAPTYGITLGISNILQAQKIILLITGANKKEIFAELMKGRVTTQVPASVLWLHPNVECIIDESCLK